MRHAKVDAEEILKAEKAKDDRQRSRKNGYSMMGQRDAGVGILSNGAEIYWPVPEEWSEPTADGIHTMNRRRLPDGTFVLKINGRETLFDTEEFRRFLRWA